MQPWIDLQQFRHNTRADPVTHETNVVIARILKNLDVLWNEGAKVVTPETEKGSDHVASRQTNISHLPVK